MRSTLGSVALIATLLTAPIFAQNRIAVAVNDPEFENLKSPEFEGTNPKKWDHKDWLEMEVEFEVEKIDPRDAKFVDRLSVRWYVAAQHPDPKNKKFILLEKEVRHINIPVGEKIFSSVYLSPSAVKRLSGGDRASEKVIKYVGGEILFNGSKVAEFSSKGQKPGWWQSGSLSRYDSIPLRSKNETPFHYFWWDRYAENEVNRR